MKSRTAAGVLGTLLILGMQAVAGEAAVPDEMGQKRAWVEQNLVSSRALAPFPSRSPTMGGPHLPFCLPGQGRSSRAGSTSSASSVGSRGPTERPGSASAAKRSSIMEFPTVEWTLHVKNTESEAQSGNCECPCLGDEARPRPEAATNSSCTTRRETTVRRGAMNPTRLASTRNRRTSLPAWADGRPKEHFRIFIH